MKPNRRWCVHYRGISPKQCAAGVEMATVLKRHDPPVKLADGKSTLRLTLPCIPEWNPAGIQCEKCHYPSPEEIAAEEAEMNVRLERVRTAKSAIVAAIGPYTKGKTRGCDGSLPCPICKTGRLHYSRAGYNGHIHARCSTENCVSWME